MALVSRVLPPSQVSLRLEEEGAEPFHAKCSIIDLRSFRRETSFRRRDHFCIGRLFQPSEVVYAASKEVAEDLLDALVSAHTETLHSWVRPWLAPRFDVPGYCLTLLRVSLGQEIRPEPEGRAQALFAAQESELVPAYGLLLRDLGAAGELSQGPEGFALVHPVGFGEHLRLEVYFVHSLVRATLRWAKHVVTFEGWLDYIVRKVSATRARRRAQSVGSAVPPALPLAPSLPVSSAQESRGRAPSRASSSCVGVLGAALASMPIYALSAGPRCRRRQEGHAVPARRGRLSPALVPVGDPPVERALVARTRPPTP